MNDSNRYPFAPCLHPVKLRNPYTGEIILVPCGKCQACLLKKSQTRTLRLQCEAKAHKYCLFVTLTYDNDSIPRVGLEHSIMSRKGLENHFDLRVQQVGRFFEPDTLKDFDGYLSIGNFFSKVQDLQSYTMLMRKKQRLPDTQPGIAVLCKRDVQLFLKRLRKYVFKNTQERLRYFLCGEYGPQTFRPHYHFLLFFSDERTYDLLMPRRLPSDTQEDWYRKQHSFPCWKYGRCDTQLASDAASYVSSYINSSCSLPEVLKVSSVRPFCLHSNYLGENVLESQSEKIYWKASYGALKACVELGGKSVELPPFKSYYSRLFPLCRGYASKSPEERLVSYTLASKAIEYFGEGISLFAAARQITSSIYHYCDKPSSGYYDYDPSVVGLLRLFRSEFPETAGFSFSLRRDSFEDDERFEKICRSVYLGLLVSKRFLNIARTFNIDHVVLVRIIDQFYKSRDYELLRSFYESQERSFSFDEFALWYDNFTVELQNFDLLSRSPKYVNYRASVLKRFDDSVKHKKLNDANRIFLYNSKL